MRSSVLSGFCTWGIVTLASALAACQGQAIEVGAAGGAAGEEDRTGSGGGQDTGSGGQAGEPSSEAGGVDDGSGGGVGPEQTDTSDGGQGGEAGSIDPGSIPATPGVTKTDKVDVLLVVDNSRSMQDKQILLSKTVPRLLGDIVNPPCVDQEGNRAEIQPASPDEICPEEGTVRTHMPVKDLHLGAISSSLGGHGNPQFCRYSEQNDNGRLIDSSTRPGSALVTNGYVGLGFLAWDTREADDPARHEGSAISDLAELNERATSLVAAVGEDGCGYEATLESWYRFLIDPYPPAGVFKDKITQETVRSSDLNKADVDEALLEQREAFLRPDSALVIIILSDENDCSIRDSDYGWLATKVTVYPSTAICETNPNDRCCTYCGFESAPEGCPAHANDPGCQREPDRASNIRCWDMKRRFGIDFLYPVTRYLAGLQDRLICPDSSAGDGDCRCRRAQELGEACTPGTPVTNPLYQDLEGLGREVRDPSLVSVIGIVGVPWQDLATDASVDDPFTLRFKAGTDVDWDLVLGDPSTGTEPLDALMIESVEPRTDAGPHPITGILPAPPESAHPLANPINGHEWSPVNNEDLQYACIFPLAPLGATARDCNIINEQTCDCFDPTADLNTINTRKKPLCQKEDGSYGSVQNYAKAYPGTRHLELLKGLDAQAFPASICPKVLASPETDQDYGYHPAIAGVLRKLRRILE